MSELHSFERSLASAWPVEGWGDLTVLVAVSGGADSVALLRSLVRIREEHSSQAAGRLVVGHFNHGWRGAESDADARFVRTLAEQLAVPVVVGRARVKKPGFNGSKSQRSEEAARKLRYRFLADVSDRIGARYVVTAHTADDQVETILQRVLRGTGLAGLAGIPRVRRLTPAATLIRPMLPISRREVVEYLQLLGQSYREDSSNASGEFIRNRIRRELLPLARDLYGDVDGALLRLGFLAGEAQATLHGRVQDLSQQAVVESTPNQLVLRAMALRDAEPFMLRETLRLLWLQQRWPCQNMGLEQWNALAALFSNAEASAGPQTHTFPGNVRAKTQGELLTLTRPAEVS